MCEKYYHSNSQVCAFLEYLQKNEPVKHVQWVQFVDICIYSFSIVHWKAGDGD